VTGRNSLAATHLGVAVAAFGLASAMGVLQALSVADVAFPRRSEPLYYLRLSPDQNFSRVLSARRKRLSTWRYGGPRASAPCQEYRQWCGASPSVNSGVALGVSDGFTAQGCDACHGDGGVGTAAAPKPVVGRHAARRYQ
jgi:hypothetical protein